MVKFMNLSKWKRPEMIISINIKEIGEIIIINKEMKKNNLKR